MYKVKTVIDKAEVAIYKVQRLLTKAKLNGTEF